MTLTAHISRYNLPLSGFILPTVMVFGAIFLTIGVGLASYLLEMQRAEHFRINDEEAFAIAEAGLNYYAWHLAHFPADLTDGTGHGGPYVHAYADPEGGTVGTYSLSVSGNTACDQTTSIDITSTGTTVFDPNRSVALFGRYARQSVASYSYVINSTVWAGSTRTILGRYHSNGGVRMDGNNKSTVESSVANWTCNTSFGCQTTQTVNGVFGSGSNPELWNYPVPQVDFAGITVDLATLKSVAGSSGLYFPPASGSQTQRGYHLIFKSDGTVDVYRVTGTTAVWGSPDGSSEIKEYNVISSQTYLGNYVVPQSCPVVFVEDRVWVEGTVQGKISLAAADLTGDGYNPDVILPNNINYVSYNGTNGLTVVAAGNVLLPLNSPDTMSLHGIFIAQNGYYGRNYYFYQSGNSHSVPLAYKDYVTRSALTTVGTIVSNGRTGTSWLCGSTTCSGYLVRNDSYDGTLASNPPPFTPYTSTQYHFVLWRQE